MTFNYKGKYNGDPDILPRHEHASGAGDYINIFNALTQMPAGSYTYLYGFSSYWYLPENK